MKRSTIATLATIGLTTASLGLAAPTLAAPAEVESAPDTVNRLQSEGYTVIVNKVGSAALSECTVTAVRPGRDVTHRITVPGSDGTIEQLRYTTVYVDVKC